MSERSAKSNPDRQKFLQLLLLIGGQYLFYASVGVIQIRQPQNEARRSSL